MESEKKDFFEWLERLENASVQKGHEIYMEALERAGAGLQDCLMSMPTDQPWEVSREMFKTCFSDLTSLGHVAVQFENMTQHPEESLCLYIQHYSKMHYAATNKTQKKKKKPQILLNLIDSWQVLVILPYWMKFSNLNIFPGICKNASRGLWHQGKAINFQNAGGSCLSHTAVKPDSHLAQIFVAKFLCIIKLIIIIG